MAPGTCPVPFGQFTTQSIGFNGGGPTSAAFSFVSPKRLVQVDAYNGGSAGSTVTLSCAGQPTAQLLGGGRSAAGAEHGRTGTCTSVTVTSSNGWDTNFDSMVIQ